MKFKHPHISPDLVIEVPDEKVAAHVAAGWLPQTLPGADVVTNGTGEPEPLVTPERATRRDRTAKENE